MRSSVGRAEGRVPLSLRHASPLGSDLAVSSVNAAQGTATARPTPTRAYNIPTEVPRSHSLGLMDVAHSKKEIMALLGIANQDTSTCCFEQDLLESNSFALSLRPAGANKGELFSGESAPGHGCGDGSYVELPPQDLGVLRGCEERALPRGTVVGIRVAIRS